MCECPHAPWACPHVWAHTVLQCRCEVTLPEVILSYLVAEGVCSWSLGVVASAFTVSWWPSFCVCINSWLFQHIVLCWLILGFLYKYILETEYFCVYHEVVLADGLRGVHSKMFKISWLWFVHCPWTFEAWHS